MVSLFYSNKLIDHNVFTLCFAPNGGYFSVGGVNRTYHNEEVKYIPFYSNSGFYKVKLNDVIVNSKHFEIKENEYYTVIDSGTTISYFPRELYKNVEKQINEFCSQINRCLGDSYKTDAGLCFKLKDNVNISQFIESMPKFTFIFEGKVKYDWKPENYLYNYTEFADNPSEGETFCIGLTSWQSSEILLGSTWMHNHDIIFDADQNKIGLVESNCEGSGISAIVKDDNFNGSNASNLVIDSANKDKDKDKEKDNTTTGAISNRASPENIPVKSPAMPGSGSATSACDDAINFYSKLILFITFISFVIIVLLVITVNKMRRGQNFLFMRVNSNENNEDRELNRHVEDIDNVMKNISEIP